MSPPSWTCAPQDDHQKEEDDGETDLSLVVVAEGVPSCISTEELVGFLSGAIVAVTGNEPLEFLEAAPCSSCLRFDSEAGVAELSFHTALAATAAICLDGLECRGSRLTLRRPEGYQAPSGPGSGGRSYDPIWTLEPILEQVAAEALLGLADVNTLAKSRPKRASRWYERGWTGNGAYDGGKDVGNSVLAAHVSHYDLLQVLPCCSAQEVRKAFLGRCRACHPDARANAYGDEAACTPASLAEFHRISEAYHTLSNPSKREAYDRQRLLFDACEGCLRHDARAAAFLLKHLTKLTCPGVRRLSIEHRLAGAVASVLPQLKLRSRADLLVIRNHVGQRGQTQNVAEVLVAGSQATVATVQSLLRDAVAEADGLKVPQDGVVIRVPRDLQAKAQSDGRPVVADNDLQRICEQTKASVILSGDGDRVVVRRLQHPLAVVMVQQLLDWRGVICHPDGTERDAWSFAFLAERQVGGVNIYLVPKPEPDLATITKIFSMASQPAGRSAVIDEPMPKLGARVIEAASNSPRSVPFTLIKVASAMASFQEVKRHTLEVQANYVCALMDMWAIHKVQLPLGVFTLHPVYSLIEDVRQLFAEQQGFGLSMRARGFELLTQVVTDSGLWCPWSHVMGSTSIVGFLIELMTWHRELKSASSSGVETADASSMITVPTVIGRLLKLCTLGYTRVCTDPLKGLRILPQPPSSMAPVGMVPPPGPPPSGPPPPQPGPPPRAPPPAPAFPRSELPGSARPRSPSLPPPTKKKTRTLSPLVQRLSRPRSISRRPDRHRRGGWNRSRNRSSRARSYADKDRRRRSSRSRNRRSDSRSPSRRRWKKGKKDKRARRRRRSSSVSRERAHQEAVTKREQEEQEAKEARQKAEDEQIARIWLPILEEELLSYCGRSYSLAKLAEWARVRLHATLDVQWFQRHSGVFRLTRFAPDESAEADDWSIQLTTQAQNRATGRHKRLEELAEVNAQHQAHGAAQQKLATLMLEDVEDLSPSDAAAMLCLLSEGARSSFRKRLELASSLLRRAVQHGDLAPDRLKELRDGLRPFTPSRLMKALVDLVKGQGTAASEGICWEPQCLAQLLAASTMELLETGGRSSLIAGAEALHCATRRPFVSCHDTLLLELLHEAVGRLSAELSDSQLSDAVEVSMEDELAGDLDLLAKFSLQLAQMPSELQSAGVKIPEAEVAKIRQALALLCDACGSLSDADGSRAPGTEPLRDLEALSQLALAVAFTASLCQVEGRSVALAALEHVALRCLPTPAAQAAVVPSPLQLARLATAFGTAQESNEEVFKRLGDAAEFQAQSGADWRPQDLWTLLEQAETLKCMEQMEGLLWALQTWGALVRHASAAPLTQLPLLVDVAVRLDSPSLLSPWVSRCSRGDLGASLVLKRLVGIIQGWPDHAAMWFSLAPLRSEVLAAAVEAAATAAPGALSVTEVRTLLRAASEPQQSTDLLKALRSAPALLSAIRSGPLEEVRSEVGPVLRSFTDRNVSAPGLQGACVAQLLKSLVVAQAGDMREISAAVQDLAAIGILRDLPAVLAAVSELPALQQAAQTGNFDEVASEKLVTTLLREASACASTKEARCNSVDEETAKLDRWASQLEALSGLDAEMEDDCAEDAREAEIYDDASEEWLFEDLLSLAEALQEEMTSVPEATRPEGLPALEVAAAKSTLGPLWLEVLLLRCRRLSWDGGSRIRLRRPQPRLCAQRLAEFFSGVPPSLQLPSAWPPLLLVRGTGEKDHDGVAGTYVAAGDYDGRRAFRRSSPLGEADVLLYYCGDHQVEAAQRGWWFGTELGGDLVWLRNPSLSSAARDRPPRKGWVLHSTSQPTPLRVLFCEAKSLALRPDEAQLGPRGVSPPPGMQNRRINVNEVATPQRHGRRQDLDDDDDNGEAAALTFATGVAQVATKRRREETQAERELQFKDWLSSLDNGAGAMLQYFDRLAAEFDADLTQIKACRISDGTDDHEEVHLGSIDKVLWEAAGIKKLGHRMLFARGIALICNPPRL